LAPGRAGWPGEGGAGAETLHSGWTRPPSRAKLV